MAAAYIVSRGLARAGSHDDGRRAAVGGSQREDYPQDDVLSTDPGHLVELVKELQDAIAHHVEEEESEVL